MKKRTISTLILKKGREDSLYRRHPWVFSGSISKVEGDPVPGETVEILSSRGEYLASASYSPMSKIRARVWSWNRDQEINASFIKRRILNSISNKKNIQSLFTNTNAIRLVNAESDGMPGLIVDQYGDVLSVQLMTAGVEYWRDVIVDTLRRIENVTSVYERSDVDIRRLEGLEERRGVLWGNEPDILVPIMEDKITFLVDIREGQKTGFYLDQRSNRKLVLELAAGREVLDCFSYTGGFTLASLMGGASTVTAIDASKDALDVLRKNIAINKFGSDNVEIIEGDVFQTLRLFRNSGRKFDMIVLDPPKFAYSSSMVDRAARGYKDINLLAFKLLKPCGLLFTFSCSGSVSMDLFQKIVAGAALDASVDSRIIMRLHQDIDHPVALNFPEGDYLKGLLVYIA